MSIFDTIFVNLYTHLHTLSQGVSICEVCVSPPAISEVCEGVRDCPPHTGEREGGTPNTNQVSQDITVLNFVVCFFYYTAINY